MILCGRREAALAIRRYRKRRAHVRWVGGNQKRLEVLGGGSVPNGTQWQLSIPRGQRLFFIGVSVTGPSNPDGVSDHFDASNRL